MNPDLFQLKELILLFRNQLADRIPWGQERLKSSLQQWEKDKAYSWIFLEINYLFFWGLNAHDKQRCVMGAVLKKLKLYTEKLWH